LYSHALAAGLLLAVILAGTATYADSSAAADSVAPKPVFAGPASRLSSLQPSSGSGMSEQAQYEAFAGAVNLRPGDLPGFAVGGPSGSGGASEGSRCGISALGGRPLADFPSDQFASGTAIANEQATSDVEIESSPAVARQADEAFQRALRKHSTRRCLTREIGGGIRRSLLKVGARHKGELQVLSSQVRLGEPSSSPPPSGIEADAELSVGVRVVIRVSAYGREATTSLSLSLETQLLAIGRAQITLTIYSLNKAFPAQLETRLYGLMVSRAVSSASQFPALEAA
jgi:hypothetical protein